MSPLVMAATAIFLVGGALPLAPAAHAAMVVAPHGPASAAHLVGGISQTTGATPPNTTPSTPATTWVPVWRDDFSGTAIDKTKWSVYNGSNGGSPRSSANAFVSGGFLTLRTSQISGVWTSAGVSNSRSFSQTYGKFEIRARVDGAAGTRATALLWPAGGGWPPEVDFLEIGATDPLRTTNLTANHYSSLNSMQHVAVTSDYRSWHTIGVEWTPTSLVYTLDGAVTGTVTGHVPAQNMWLGLQSRIGFTPETQPNSTTPANVDYQIDWVQISRMS